MMETNAILAIVRTRFDANFSRSRCVAPAGGKLVETVIVDSRNARRDRIGGRLRVCGGFPARFRAQSVRRMGIRRRPAVAPAQRSRTRRLPTPDGGWRPTMTCARAGAQAMFPIGDLSAPILQPWAREQMRQRNERVLAGKPGFSQQASCWPVGVPAFLTYAVQPVYFVQSPKEVLMIWQADHQIRHVYMNVPHSPNPKPSWFGESVGHYEGDTLVVDTIASDTRTFIDQFDNAAYGSTAHHRALPHDQWRQDDGGQSSRRGSRRLHHAMGRHAAL